jgi:DNA-binding CsgD family transcriptional regulator
VNQVAPMILSGPRVPLDLAQLSNLRRTLAGTTQPIYPIVATVVSTLSAQHAHLDLHVSSQAISSSYVTYPITSGGLRYGTISHALPPPPALPFALLRCEFQRLATECSDLLQFLDLVQWQRWQRSHGAARRQEQVTARERDILLHYFVGYSRQEIATRLCVAPTTVKTHLRNLYEKLEVHTMQEALAVGRAAGLLLHLL